MIEFNHVTKNFRDTKAVNDVCLTIPEGSFFALLGPNGVGKTTLIRMLTSLIKPDSGEILVKGSKVSRTNSDIKKLFGVATQHNNLDKELNARENLEFAGRLYGMQGEQLKSRIDEMVAFAGLEEAKGRMAKNLSGGMQRKLMIAKALMHDPQILILDEPTVGVDPVARRRIWDILKSINSLGKTVLLTTHYIEEAEQLCEKVALMNAGRIYTVEAPKALIDKLGRFTVEYFSPENGTKYAYYAEQTQAKEFAGTLDADRISIRSTTLEDVFFDFTSRKVADYDNNDCFMA